MTPTGKYSAAHAVTCHLQCGLIIPHRRKHSEQSSLLASIVQSSQHYRTTAYMWARKPYPSGGTGNNPESVGSGQDSNRLEAMKSTRGRTKTVDGRNWNTRRSNERNGPKRRSNAWRAARGREVWPRAYLLSFCLFQLSMTFLNLHPRRPQSARAHTHRPRCGNWGRTSPCAAGRDFPV